MSEAKTAPEIKLGVIIKEFDLEVLLAPENYEEVPLETLDINRPGLPLAGFLDHFDTKRLLVIGQTEYAYIETMDAKERLEAFERLLSYPVPGIIYTRGVDPFPDFIEVAQKHDRTVLRSPMPTSMFISQLISSLYRNLSPCITRSGVLLEIYGEGVLIQGISGVGKSEVAIELIKRGHRIIADDAVEIQEITPGILEGKAPELIEHYMELRGIGVIDVKQLFGMGAIKAKKTIELIIILEPWDDNTHYDRLGLEVTYSELLGVEIPSVTIPVKPGRNLASIVEVAAMNNRNREMGHNAALELTKKMDKHFKEQEALMKQKKENSK
ncbi:MAG: HPr(Ser) kinase/phosphatase [Eubacteriales bacterium]